MRGGNLQAFESRDREFILSGPTGTGKSLGLLAKAHYLAEKYPKARILLLRKTRESMTDSVLVTFERDVLGDDHYLTQGQRKEFRHSYIYKNGSEIVVAGMRHNQKDQKAKIMSTDYDMILVFEATEFLLDEWEKLNTRLRSGVLPYQQLGGDCNPDAPTSWIWSRQLSGRLKFFQSFHKDNPRWYDGKDWTESGREYIERLKTSLSGYLRDRLFDGKWVQASGAIFDTWSEGEGGNVTELAEYEDGAGRVYWAVDDGYSAGNAVGTHGLDPNTGLYVADAHPRVILFIQIKPDGHIDVFNESYACLKLSNEHFQDCLDLKYPKPEYAIHGPGGAEIRGRLYEKQIVPRQSTAGVEDSIKEMRTRLAADKNSWRMVRVHPRCKHFRSEMLSCIYDPQSGKPVKAFDHGPDALRGFIWVTRREL